MEQSVVPSREAAVDDSRTRKPRKLSRSFSAMGLRTRSILAGILAAAILTLLIALGSRGFHWFDAALIGYAVASIFAIAAVTYKYSFWLARPPTGRYWRRSWQLFFSYENFRRYSLLIPKAIGDLFAQQFIRKRGLYRIWVFGFPFFTVPVASFFAFMLFHALDFTALLLLVGLILAFHRRFHDLALISVQRFGFDIVPLALLLAITVTGLALTADSTWLRGAYYWYISLTHETVVVLWLISLPFGKFFHLIERPATVGIELYWRTGEGTEMQRCARCKEEFAPVRFIQDLKKTLYDVGENYTLHETPVAQENGRMKESAAEAETTDMLWWQDLCPTCKRVMRAQVNLAALGRGGNQFL